MVCSLKNKEHVYVATGIDCYMKQFGVSKEQAVEGMKTIPWKHEPRANEASFMSFPSFQRIREEHPRLDPKQTRHGSNYIRDEIRDKHPTISHHSSHHFSQEEKTHQRSTKTWTTKVLNTSFTIEFQPCKELTGGDWYIDGALDVSKIEGLKEICVNILERLMNKVAFR